MFLFVLLFFILLYTFSDTLILMIVVDKIDTNFKTKNILQQIKSNTRIIALCRAHMYATKCKCHKYKNRKNCII